MSKARKRKDSEFQTTLTKSVFLYGNPNKGKWIVLQQMQDSFTKLVNRDIQILNEDRVCRKKPDIPKSSIRISIFITDTYTEHRNYHCPGIA